MTLTKEHYCQIQDSGRTFSDQTGRFPTTSRKGIKYIMVCYHHDTNAISAEPLKNRTEGEINRAFENMHTKLCTAGYTPKCHRLDKKCSQSLQQLMEEKDLDFQSVPPHIHWRNLAERAIKALRMFWLVWQV